MDKEMIKGMSPERKAKVAVGYLVQNKELRPESTVKLFDKLLQYNNSMNEIMTAVEQSKKSVREMEVRGEQMFGAIESVVEMISEELPEDKVDEWCEKYEIPEIPRNVSMAGNIPAKQAGPSDIAGSTSNQNPPPAPPEK